MGLWGGIFGVWHGLDADWFERLRLRLLDERMLRARGLGVRR